MNSRSTRVAGPAPLTPDLLGRTDLVTVQKERIEELAAEVRKLRAALSYEKRKHQRIEDALSRHLGQLDRTMSDMKSAVITLGKSLLPSELK